MEVALHELLFEKFMEYQKNSGQRKTLKEFSEYIGVGQVYLNRLMNQKRKAGEKTIHHLADFFTDPRFYDVAKLDRPEPSLTYIKRNWGKVPNEIKNKIVQEVAQYSIEPLPKDDEWANGE